MAESKVHDPGAAAETSRRLNSWKEIAAYFNRDVRTVRRWESELGLPVHRRQHTRRGIVHAYESELDTWWKAGRKRPENVDATPAAGSRLLILAASVAGVLLLAGGYFAWLRIRGNTPSPPFEIIRTTTLTNAGRSGKAAISPDGRYIAHTVVTSGEQSLWVRRAATLYDIELVPPGPVRYVGITFSPNSETLYYITAAPDGGRSILYRIPATGGPTQKLKEGLNSPVTFSPNEEKFAFVREEAGLSTLMIADLKSGSEQRLLSRKLPEVLDYPAWSPDGQTIACTVVDSSIASPKGSGARIIEVRVLERTERPLSKQTWPFIRELAWLGNRHGMVMSARDQDTGAYHVWYVSYPGGTARKVTDGVNSQNGMSVSGDSSQLLTVEERTLSGIWRMRSNQSEDAEPVSPESANCVAPQWTADGRIVYEQQVNGQRHIWSMAADGTGRKQLTVTGSNYDPSISSDGRMLSYMSDRSGSPAMWTMDIDGGNPVMVFKTDAEPYPQLSPDGKWIAFTAAGAGYWPTLRRVRSAGGPAKELTDKMWLHPAIAPDGRWIAGFYAEHPSGTQNFPDSLGVISSDGGSPRKVIPIPPSVLTSAGIRWSPDGRELAYVDQRKEGANVWSQPLNGGVPRQLTHLHGYSLFSFDWSRDGKEFALSRGIQARDVVLIQNAKSSR